MAFDRASVRRFDLDGRLHVAMTPISRAAVNGYLGREVPDAERLGLQPDRLYQFWRHPEELESAASSFNNLPLLSEHVVVNAEDHRPDLVIGATGSNATFAAPYLINSLVIWAADAIEAIQDESKCELSSAYRYVADMTPGVTPQGQKYDGIMRSLEGSHVALVPEGRAGSDVRVLDAKPRISPDAAYLARFPHASRLK